MSFLATWENNEPHRAFKLSPQKSCYFNIRTIYTAITLFFNSGIPEFLPITEIYTHEYWNKQEKKWLMSFS